MPSYTRGVPYDQLRFVQPNKTGFLYYGWKTKDLTTITGFTATDSATLGHETAQSIQQGIKAFRANAPKPPRVKKVVRPGNADAGLQTAVSTFCGAPELAGALSNGWTLVAPAKGVGGGSPRSQLTVVETSGVNYAFSLNANDFGTYSQLIGAKQTLSDADYLTMVRGASYPRPAKMGFYDPNNNGTFSTYVADSVVDNLVRAGWSIIKSKRESLI